ncbi:hypothetical protein AB0L65_61610 [Nonomuraea sp. NPDC052116]|uniref:hypothetical protein n=1 Tax=Nonomuraea sp. NPDC052116 TaxID=3155665 RepID=UPI00342E583E
MRTVPQAIPGAAEEVQRIGYLRQFNRHVRTAIVTLEDGTRVGPLGGLPVTECTADVGTRRDARRGADRRGDRVLDRL